MQFNFLLDSIIVLSLSLSIIIFHIHVTFILQVIDANGKLGKIGDDIKSIEAFIASLVSVVSLNCVKFRAQLRCNQTHFSLWYRMER